MSVSNISNNTASLQLYAQDNTVVTSAKTAQNNVQEATPATGDSVQISARGKALYLNDIGVSALGNGEGIEPPKTVKGNGEGIEPPKT